MKIKKRDYRNGGEGFISWCEDKVCIPIYPEGSDIPAYVKMSELPDTPNPETKRSYKGMWEAQKEVARKALAMKNGRFIHRLIVLCWMRGEGKSLFICLVKLWRFFNWPKQQIMLGANSKDQVKFVHYDIIRDILINSPELMKIVGSKNIQEKEIRLKDNKGNIRSIIRSISSFSGILSNITGFTFSEIFEMKKSKFFVQLFGSIRNVPNAIGMIDSTVSSKSHILYQLYENWINKSSSAIFFSYRSSPTGDAKDFWNPNMSQAQLDDYKATFPFGDYERYFQNLWEAGQSQVFADEMIEEMGYLGIDGGLLDHTKIKEVIDEKQVVLRRLEIVMGKGFDTGVKEAEEDLSILDKRFIPVSKYYSLKSAMTNPFCPLDSLLQIGDQLDTDWLILGGADRADPSATRGKARSIFTCVAKGLPSSRTNPYLMSLENSSLKFIYFLLQITNIEDHSINGIKDVAEMCNEEYDGIDVFCGERFGLWDLQSWCEERDMDFTPIYPNYQRQRESFNELYTLMKEGRFKAPQIGIVGSKKHDLLREEFEMFDHNVSDKWFGSPEKDEKYGVQDDSIFSVGWTIYGGKDKGPADFRIRKSLASFGVLYQNTALLGKY
uniref:Terminase n=1 Tax=viral metagenome TaxID=1070528 RepID=A0A6M3J942_9ZZZZ